MLRLLPRKIKHELIIYLSKYGKIIDNDLLKTYEKIKNNICLKTFGRNLIWKNRLKKNCTSGGTCRVIKKVGIVKFQIL